MKAKWDIKLYSIALTLSWDKKKIAEDDVGRETPDVLCSLHNNDASSIGRP